MSQFSLIKSVSFFILFLIYDYVINMLSIILFCNGLCFIFSWCFVFISLLMDYSFLFLTSFKFCTPRSFLNVANLCLNFLMLVVFCPGYSVSQLAFLYSYETFIFCSTLLSLYFSSLNHNLFLGYALSIMLSCPPHWAELLFF